MDNFDLKNYLAENKLLKENTLAGYYGDDASKKLRTLANEIDIIISDYPEKENLIDKITDLALQYAQDYQDYQDY
jgi:hypothetical protein